MMRRYMIIFFAALSLLACSRPGDTDYSGLRGRWYPEYPDMLVDKIIEFDGGSVTTYVSDDKHPAEDGIIWNSAEEDYKRLSSSRYSILDGELICSPDNLGTISLEGGALYVNGRPYNRLQGFNSAYYSTIELEALDSATEDSELVFEMELSGDPSSHELGYTVINPIPGYPEVGISYDCDWIYNCFTADGKVRFSVPEFTGSAGSAMKRTGRITITYKYAEPVYVSVTQNSLF